MPKLIEIEKQLAETKQQQESVAAKWIAIVNQTDGVQKEIAAVDARLASWAGYASEWRSWATRSGKLPVEDDDLLTTENTSLSKDELKRKKLKLAERKDLLEEQETQIGKFKLEADRLLTEMQRTYSREVVVEKTKLAAGVYNENFFNTVKCDLDLARLRQEYENCMEFPKVSTGIDATFMAETIKNRAELLEPIYLSANAVVEVIPYLKEKLPLQELMAYYQIVRTASDEATNTIRILHACYGTDPKRWSADVLELMDNAATNFKKYGGGEKQIFAALSSALPAELQGICFLPEEKRVEFLQQADKLLANTADYAIFLQQLAVEVNHRCLDSAEKLLVNVVGFKQLDSEVQKQLIEQKALLIKVDSNIRQLQAYSKLPNTADMQTVKTTIDKMVTDFSAQSAKIQANIENAILNKANAAACIEDSKNIKIAMDNTETKARSDLFASKMAAGKIDFKILSGVGMASGFGVGWLAAGLGLGVSVGTGAIIPAVGLAGYHYYKSRTDQIPNITEAQELASDVLPIDYIYLDQADKAFGFVAKPSSIESSFTSKIAADAKKQFEVMKQAGIDELKKPIKEAAAELKSDAKKIKNSVVCGVKVATGLPASVGIAYGIGMGIALLAGAAVPPLWPLYAIVGAGLFIGAAVGAVRYIVKDPNIGKILDKIANTLFTPFKLLGKVLNHIVVNPIKALIANFKAGNKTRGYVIIGVTVALAIVGGVLLPGAGALLGLSVGAALGVTLGVAGAATGAVAGLNAGAVVSKVTDGTRKFFADNKPYQSTVQFKLAEKNADLNAPFCNLLEQHFYERAVKFNAEILAARAEKNPAKEQQAIEALLNLELSWEQIVNKAENPELLYKAADIYINTAYREQRNIFVEDAKGKVEDSAPKPILSADEKAKLYTAKKTEAHAHGMIEHDFVAARKCIQQLQDLKSYTRPKN